MARSNTLLCVLAMMRCRAASPLSLRGARTATDNNTSVTTLNASSLNLDDAKRHVLLANSAYCSKSAVEAWTCASCKKVSGVSSVTFIEDSKKSVYAFAAADDSAKTVILSFRGTDDTRNWVENLDFIKTSPYSDFKGAEVHQGFYNDWKAVSSKVASAVDSLRMSTGYHTVTPVGHSLGGALATLCAFDLARGGYPIAAVWTAGSPRVGNEDFASAVKKVLSTEWRLTHYYDIVPHVPPEGVGFHHVSREYWINEANTKAKTCDGSGEDPTCSDSCGAHCDSIDDHLDYLKVKMGSDHC